MTRRTIDYETARDTLCALARETPASEASGTYLIVDYFARDFEGVEVGVSAPYCIVANALARWGVDVVALFADAYNDAEFAQLLRLDAIPLRFEPAAQSLITRTQSYVDNGNTWARAVTKALADVPVPVRPAPTEEPW